MVRRTSSRGGRRSKGKESGPDEKRAQIRLAAYRCFSQGGYHKTTIDKICAALGISKGSFYWYYSGKQALFSSILDEWAQRVQKDMARQFTDALAGPAPYDSVTKALEKETRRGRYIMPIWLEFLAQVPRVPKIRSGLADFHRRIRTFIKQLLDPSMPEHFGEEDRDALATVVLAGFIGVICLELVDPQGASAKDVVRRFMTILEYFTSTGQSRPTA
jgi:AcrR family transcriptional regulator